MRVFNRIVVTLLLVALLVLGIYGVIYSFQIAGYSLSSLEQTLGVPSILSGAQSFLQSLGQGTLPALTIAILAAIVVLGLILLILELKPRRPRHVRTSSKGVYLTRSAVRSAVKSAAESTSAVLGAKAKAKARRGAGAKAKVKASVRTGEGGESSSIRDQMNSTLSERGVPIKKLKLKLEETSPQGSSSETRVK
ncbi:Asp23/Gls24 family envelope stress response protein [Rubrobacter aplysinae]|uniref:DUF6286 domain-containing protein n=1 Tax=Rubrobacter aplysinae TaxID=909625 RepID=UPI00128E3026|nr:DUF6286 domain-containing protein [Rubrobacter aplysinae]